MSHEKGGENLMEAAIIIAILIFLFGIFGCSVSTEPDPFYIIPSNIKDIPADPINPLSQNGYESGKFFFNSKLISPSGTVACSNCHNEFGESPDPNTVGGAGLGWVFNPGSGKYQRDPNYEGPDDIMTDVVSVSFVGMAYQPRGGASGRFGIELVSKQLKKDILNHFNQDSFPNCQQGLHQANIALGGPTSAHRQFIKGRLLESNIAKANLELAFGPIKWEEETDESLKFKISKLIDQFERIEGLKAPREARFSKIMRGELNFTIPEANGFALFKTHCISCHENPVFGSNDVKVSFMSDNGGPNPNHLAQISGDVPDNINYYRMVRPLLGRLNNIRSFGYDGRYKSANEYMVDKYYYLELNDPMNTLFQINSFSDKEKYELKKFMETL